MADVESTRTSAAAKSKVTGDPRWQERAEGRLGRHVALWESRQAALAEVDREVERTRSELLAVDDVAERVIVLAREAIWNAAGRPGPNDDPYIELLFPEGSGTYADESLEGSADAMEFLAELLLTVGHPEVPREVLEQHAKQIEEHAARHRAALVAHKPALAKQKLLGKACTAIAKSARIQLVKLKRALELDGFSEAEIHTVIPDRSGPSKAKAATPVAPAEPKVA